MMCFAEASGSTVQFFSTPLGAWTCHSCISIQSAQLQPLMKESKYSSNNSAFFWDFALTPQNNITTQIV